MRWIFVAALVGLLGAPAHLFAGSPPEGGCIPRRFLAEVVRVIDGDTIVVRVLIPEWSLTSVQRLRLLGIDTPEMKAPRAGERQRARQAKALVEQLVGPTRQVLVEAPRCRRGYYGRPLVRVLTLDGKDIAEEIKRAGLEKEKLQF
ncbi:MAG: thermonuclease family protein [bacterium]|nr:thermonuclease family protein [bacterium]